MLVLVGCSTQPMMMANHVGPSVQIDGSGLSGGELAASHSFGGLGLAAHAFGERLEREEVGGIRRRATGIGIDLGLRLSLFGLVADDHRLEHWFDIGLSGGTGGGGIKPARLETFGHAWIGFFTTVGLWRGERYPSLMLEVRRETVQGWDDRTVFVVGLAFTRRYPDEFRPLH